LLLVELPEHAVGQDLREPDDGVERRPQLVRHIRQELRLVLAGDFDLAALLGDLLVTGLELLEQPDVFDSDHCLVGERLEERDLFVGEGPDLRAADPDDTERDPVAQERHGERRLHAVLGRGRLGILRQGLREVPVMNCLAVDHRAAHQVSPRQAAHRWHRRHAEGGDEAEHLAFHAKHLRVVRAAQASGIRGNGVKHRLDVGRRGRDHTQDFARSRLLLEGFRERPVARFELLEQSHVLDRDDRLGGEGFNERDLLFRKRLDLAPPEA
jgi:hypothetical protein